MRDGDRTVLDNIKIPPKVSKVPLIFWGALAVIAIGLGVWLFG